MKYSKTNPPFVCMMDMSECYQRTNTMNVLGVLWHGTGCYNPYIGRYVWPSEHDPRREEIIKALGETRKGDDWNHKVFEPGEAVGVNAFIGLLDDQTVTSVQVMPWNFSPWGCGGGTYGTCNHGWIQFEACQDYPVPSGLVDRFKTTVDTEDYFKKIYKEGCELTAYLCLLYDLDPLGYVEFKGQRVPVILDHAESHKLGLGSNHGDITSWLNLYDKTMDDVRKDIAKILKEYKEEITTQKIYDEPQTQEQYIWYYLLGAINDFKTENSKIITSALVANILCESDGNPITLDKKYQDIEEFINLNMSNEFYTLITDNNRYTNFKYDGAGYGLAQWANFEKKQNLLIYSHKNTKEKIQIGNLKIQLDFLLLDLQKNHPKEWNKLLESTTTEKAVDAIYSYFRLDKNRGGVLSKVKSTAKKLLEKYEQDIIRLNYVLLEGPELMHKETSETKEPLELSAEDILKKYRYKNPFPMYKALLNSLCETCGQFHQNCICPIINIIESSAQDWNQQYFIQQLDEESEVVQTFPKYEQRYSKGKDMTKVKGLVFYYSPKSLAEHLVANNRMASLSPAFIHSEKSPTKIDLPFHYCIGKNEKNDIVSVNTFNVQKTISQSGNSINGTCDDNYLHILICGKKLEEQEMLREIGNLLRPLCEFYELDNEISKTSLPDIISIDEAISMGYASNEQYSLSQYKPWNIFINNIRNSLYLTLEEGKEINTNIYYVYDYNPVYSAPRLIGQFYNEEDANTLQQQSNKYGVFKYNDQGILEQIKPNPEKYKLELPDKILLSPRDKWADNSNIDNSYLENESYKILSVSPDKYDGYFVITNRDRPGMVRLIPR